MAEFHMQSYWEELYYFPETLRNIGNGSDRKEKLMQLLGGVLYPAPTPSNAETAQRLNQLTRDFHKFVFEEEDRNPEKDQDYFVRESEAVAALL